MAHFAQLDENNIVIEVIVISNEEILDENGNELESKGIARCKEFFGENTRWVQTSYNNNIRKNFAGKGYTYREDLDSFIPPKRYESWILDEETSQWVAPIPYPNDGEIYLWNEKLIQWVKIEPSPNPEEAIRRYLEENPD